MDLGTNTNLNKILNEVDRAKLIPIIPPSRGHGFDLYTELGADKILIYTRFDDSSLIFQQQLNFLKLVF